MVNSRDAWEEFTKNAPELVKKEGFELTTQQEDYIIELGLEIAKERREAMLNDDEAPNEGLEEIRKHEECIDDPTGELQEEFSN